ncbi:hypothetical protein DPMN_073889 [Dreissena polymorpha]|uniref:Uncharacterized protein n=1 Tax=Dreissena polymorpha TaxID=45954 RepID=A0A9D4BL24_DREPO|nr:hypothetical protein DPMN_073889 [Dreissena polymorpha]
MSPPLITWLHDSGDQQYIIRTNSLTKFHEEINAPPPDGHAFHQTQTIQNEDWTINVPSRVLTRKTARPLAAMFFNQPELFQDIIWKKCLTKKNAPQPGGHVFQPNGTIFELVQDIGTNLLTKFHEDHTVNVASGVLTRQNVDHTLQMMGNRQSQKLTIEHVMLR